MKTFVVAAVLAMGLVGCGTGFCERQEDCAKKSGMVFSVTECRTQDKIDREKSDAKSCAKQYDELTSCIGGLSCPISAESIVGNCGNKYQLWEKCVQ
jgi:hypothetical protein